MTTENVASRPSAFPKDFKRIPMSVPQQRLHVPDLPGYHLHWFLEKRVPRAMQGGYERVDNREVHVNQLNVGTSGQISGSSDLGSHITLYAGVDEQGNPESLVLMKIRNEWWEEDQRALAEEAAKRLGGIFRGENIINGANAVSNEDSSVRYVDQERSLFQRPTRKSAK